MNEKLFQTVTEGDDDQHVHRSPAHTARLVLAAVLIVAALAIVVDNRGSVRFHYLAGDVRAPLVVIVLISALLGAIIGWLLLHRPHRGHS